MSGLAAARLRFSGRFSCERPLTAAGIRRLLSSRPRSLSLLMLDKSSLGSSQAVDWVLKNT